MGCIPEGRTAIYESTTETIENTIPASLHGTSLASQWRTTIYEDEYVRPLDLNARLIVLKAEQGTGKTQQALAALSMQSLVLLITHRISLSKDVQARFNRQEPETKADHYLGVEDVSRHAGNLAIVVNSVPKLDLSAFEDAVIYIDEVSQLLEGLPSRLFDSCRLDVVDALRCLLSSARHVVVSDRDVCEADIVLLQQWMGIEDDDVEVIHNTYLPTNRIATWHETKGDALQAAWDALANDRKVFIASDSKEECKRIAEQLEVDGHAVLLFTADEDGIVKSAVMKDINVYVRDYDVMVVSPALFTGVDLHEGHFDDVVLIGTNTGDLPSRDYLQALHRVRNPQGGVHVWIREKQHTKTTDPDKLRKELEQKLCFTLEHLERPNIETLHSASRDFRTHFVETAARTNADIVDLAQRFRDQLHRAGYLIEEVPSADVSPAVVALETRAGTSREEREEVLRRIRGARLSLEMHDDCISFPEGFFRETYDYRVAMRYRHLNGNSVEDFDAVVRHIDPSVFASEVWHFELMMNPISHSEAQEGASIKRDMGINPRGSVARAKLLHDIRGVLGDELQRPIDDDVKVELREVLLKHRHTLDTFFGQRVPEQEKVMTTVRVLLSKAGLEIERTRVRVDGQRPTIFQVDADRFEVMQRVLQRRGNLSAG